MPTGLPGLPGGSSGHPDCLRRPFLWENGAGTGFGHGGTGAAPPQLGDGAEGDHRFRHDDEQGLGDDWGGVAAFRTFQQACALLPEQGSDAVCSAVYGQLLHPDGAKAHLPEIIAVMEPLAQDPTDASARLRLYELRDLLQEDA